ncbi:MAG: methyltransferase, partial [Alphaproteobacteria bacterium]
MTLDPTHIVQTGMAFWGSKVLLSAIELGLFTALGRDSKTAGELADALGLHPRAIPDFPDALVALKLLDRTGEGPGARYANTPETAKFLDRSSPEYIGGFLEMCSARLYRFWADLTEALQTGVPQNEVKHTGESMFAKLYEVPERLEQFMNAMRGISAENFRMFAQSFDFSQYGTHCDIGGATGQLSCEVASANPHMRCLSFDLPQVVPIAVRHIAAAALSDRVQAVGGDFFAESL